MVVFIHGSSALVVTDHSCLRDLTTAKEFNNKRLMRYAVELSEHNLKVVFRPGRDHHLAGLMSRVGDEKGTCNRLGFGLFV